MVAHRLAELPHHAADVGADPQVPLAVLEGRRDHVGRQAVGGRDAREARGSDRLAEEAAVLRRDVERAGGADGEAVDVAAADLGGGHRLPLPRHLEEHALGRGAEPEPVAGAGNRPQRVRRQRRAAQGLDRAVRREAQQPPGGRRQHRTSVGEQIVDDATGRSRGRSDVAEGVPLAHHGAGVGAHPEPPVAIFGERAAVQVIESGIAHPHELPVAPDRETRTGADPQHAVAVDQQLLHSVRGQPLVDEVVGEPFAVVTGEAAPGGSPEVAVAVLGDVGDLRLWQPLAQPEHFEGQHLRPGHGREGRAEEDHDAGTPGCPGWHRSSEAFQG